MIVGTAVFKKMAVACDHGGLALKPYILKTLKDLGIEYLDFGTDSMESVDYPVYAKRVGEALHDQSVDGGIVICGSGLGIAMAANKMTGVRAAPCHTIYAARLTRKDNDANVLALGARVSAPHLAQAILEAFCTTPFEGGRHARRVEQLMKLESNDRGGSRDGGQR